MIHSKKYLLKIEFTSPILGSQPGKNTPASDYLRSKVARDRPELDIADETGTLPEELVKGTTMFHRDPAGKPAYLNYHVKGMLKNSGEVLNGLEGYKAMRSKIDNCVYVSPRVLPIDGVLSEAPLERPLRAMTAQGPRVSLARSELIEAGAKIECIIECVQTAKFTLTADLLRDLLDYGSKAGMGQWRNSGQYGQFSYILTELVEEAK
jgi:hypothetical protein